VWGVVAHVAATRVYHGRVAGVLGKAGRLDEMEGARKCILLGHQVEHSDWFALVGGQCEIAGGVYKICSLVRIVVEKIIE
jgi:hypothetical protein